MHDGVDRVVLLAREKNMKTREARPSLFDRRQSAKTERSSGERGD